MRRTNLWTLHRRKGHDHGNNDIKLPEEKAGAGKPEEPPEESGGNQGTV